jgi:predicted MFS family arabinose efflux permease
MPTRRNYVLTIVTLIYVVNYINRQILNILLPQIKAEFQLTDTQLGLLAGPVFAVVYAVLGLPLAAIADRVSRRNLITVTLGIFSVATFVCGYISSFVELLLARFVTGIGEAGTSPAACALIADLFPPAQRASALSIYASGLNIGVLIAFFAGGWIAQVWGWRVAFMSAGAPGLALVILCLLTVREPRRGAADRLRDTQSAPGLGATLRHLLQQRSFRS